MPEKQDNQNEQKEFIIEKIKERPVNRRKLMRRTLITAAMAVIFGLIACFTFLILEPIISNWLYPEEEPNIVLFPEDQEEMSPEEMLSDTMQSLQQSLQQNSQIAQNEKDNKNEQQEESVKPPEGVVLEEEQIQEILSRVTLDMDNYQEVYSALSGYVNELNHSMVTVTCISSDVDWLNNVMESSKQSSGVVIANNGKQLLILADYGPIKKAERLSVTFYDGSKADAYVIKFDETTDLTVIAVDLSGLSKECVNSITLAALGSTNIRKNIGTPIIALGSPMGSSGSLGYGIIAAESQLLEVDARYKMLQTDIYGSQNAGGFLFNLQGQMIGVITDTKSGTDMKNLITAYGISDLRKLIEKLSNNMPVAYMGIKGIDVSEEANVELNVPFGAYVTEVAKNSPAMMEGIQQGDVIVFMDGIEIQNFSEYIRVLLNAQAGKSIVVRLMRQSQKEYKEMTLTITLGESGKEG